MNGMKMKYITPNQ